MNVYQVPSTSLGHKVYGEEGYYWYDTGDGGNFMSCSGDGNFMRGGADGDAINCEGNGCDIDGREGNDIITVVNPDGPSPGGDCASVGSDPTIYTTFINVRFRVHRRTRNQFTLLIRAATAWTRARTTGR